jgi:hypothetical protein
LAELAEIFEAWCVARRSDESHLVAGEMTFVFGSGPDLLTVLESLWTTSRSKDML